MGSAEEDMAFAEEVEHTDGAARKQSLEDQEEAAWNDICNGFIKTVYAARENYSKELIRADTNQLLQRSKADDELVSSTLVKHGDRGLGLAFAASNHSRAVHKLEEDYLRANVHAVAQFKNDVEAASVYLSQRAINIVSAGNQ